MHNFSDILAKYMQALDLTECALARECGLSNASISRYMSGERSLYRDSPIIDKLAAALSDLGGGPKNTIKAQLSNGLEERRIYPDLSCKFKELTRIHHIKLTDLSSSMYYDPSYLSRIRQGHRTPRNQDTFINCLSQYIVQHQNRPEDLINSAILLNSSPDDLRDPSEYEKRLAAWLRAPIPSVDDTPQTDVTPNIELPPHHKRTKTMEFHDIELDIHDDKHSNLIYHISGRLKITVTEFPSDN